MKKIVIYVLLVLIIIAAIIGYKVANNKNFKLVIKESSWSGWTENYKPKETIKEYDVILEKEYIINKNSIYDLSFEIKKINNNSIIIETKEPFSDNKKGIDLGSKKTSFEIHINEELELTSPTMDEGSIYYLTLKKK
jgi:hypothetical protein